MNVGKLVAGIVLLIVGVIFLALGAKWMCDYSDIKSAYDLGCDAMEMAGQSCDGNPFLQIFKDEMNSYLIKGLIGIIVGLVLLLVGVVLMVAAKKGGEPAAPPPPPDQAPPPPGGY